MTKTTQALPKNPDIDVEELTEISEADLVNLCDATEAAIKDGGGFGWVDVPERDVLERFWRGVLLSPHRKLLIARLDGVACGTVQLILSPPNNQAQKHIAQLTGLFVTPWARGHGLARKLLDMIEKSAHDEELSIINCDVRETQKAMITLLRSNGYEEFGRNEYYATINGAYIPGLYFTKKLD